MSNFSLKDRASRFVNSLHHCTQLGIEVVSASETEITLKLPYGEEKVGNPTTMVLHGGVLTTLMDTACGTVVISALPEFELCPTLDLRVDYMHPATPMDPIYAKATCYRVTRNVVFTRCDIHQGNPNDAVAHCVATFMRIGTDMTPDNYRDYVLGARDDF